MRYSKGIMWLDDCRIPFVDITDRGSVDRSDRNVMMGWKTDTYVNGVGNNTLPPEQAKGNDKGRFTPNLLVCDDMLNDGSVSKSSGNNDYNWDLSNNNNPTKITKNIKSGIHFTDKGTNSRYYNLDLWFNKMLDEI